MTAALATTEPTIPPALSSEHVRVLVGYPDALLVQWLTLSPDAHDALSDRERGHARGLLPDAAACATYVRGQLATGGDRAVARARADLDVGARVSIDGRLYTVTRPAAMGRQIKLRGERGGEATLSTPAAPGQLWHGYLGRLAARTWRPIACRRVDASHFVSVPAR